MGVVLSVRQRLISGAIAALALAVTAAPTQVFAQPRDECPIPRGNVQIQDNASIRLAQSAIASAETVSALEQARQACADHMLAGRRGPHNLPAYLCVAQARLRMAQLESSGSRYGVAACDFNVAAELAARAARPPAEIAAVHDGRARALEGLSTHGGADSLAARDQAIGAYQTAADLQPTAERYFGLARALVGASRYAEADRAFTRGLAQNPENTVRASVLIEQARVRRRMSPPGETLALLEAAADLAPGSGEIAIELGKEYFDQANTAQARRSFEQAITYGPSRPGATISEAYYYLSVLDARNANTAAEWQRVVDNAEAAVRTGGGEARHRRQVCLAHIGRGGDVMRNSSGSLWCDGDETPEGKMLRGMFYLRRAQYVPDINAAANRRIWNDFLAQADGAFVQGRTMATALPNGERVLQRHYLPGSFNVLEILQFGEAAVRSTERLRCGTDIQDAATAPARAFFTRYGVLGCLPRDAN